MNKKKFMREKNFFFIKIKKAVENKVGKEFPKSFLKKLKIFQKSLQKNVH